MKVNPDRSFTGLLIDVKKRKIFLRSDCNGELITDPIVKANNLNNFYASVFSCDQDITDIIQLTRLKLFTIKISYIRKRLEIERNH